MEKQKNAEEIVELSAEELDKVTGGVDFVQLVPGGGDFLQDPSHLHTGPTITEAEILK